jgi:hypothetical protein
MAVANTFDEHPLLAVWAQSSPLPFEECILDDGAIGMSVMIVKIRIILIERIRMTLEETLLELAGDFLMMILLSLPTVPGDGPVFGQLLLMGSCWLYCQNAISGILLQILLHLCYSHI